MHTLTILSSRYNKSVTKRTVDDFKWLQITLQIFRVCYLYLTSDNIYSQERGREEKEIEERENYSDASQVALSKDQAKGTNSCIIYLCAGYLYLREKLLRIPLFFAFRGCFRTPRHKFMPLTPTINLGNIFSHPSSSYLSV